MALRYIAIHTVDSLRTGTQGSRCLPVLAVVIPHSSGWFGWFGSIRSLPAYSSPRLKTVFEGFPYHSVPGCTAFDQLYSSAMPTTPLLPTIYYYAAHFRILPSRLACGWRPGRSFQFCCRAFVYFLQFYGSVDMPGVHLPVLLVGWLVTCRHTVCPRITWFVVLAAALRFVRYHHLYIYVSSTFYVLLVPLSTSSVPPALPTATPVHHHRFPYMLPAAHTFVLLLVHSPFPAFTITYCRFQLRSATSSYLTVSSRTRRFGWLCPALRLRSSPLLCHHR